MVIVYDQSGDKVLQEFKPGSASGLKFSSEEPYGMMDASFELPIEFSSVQTWANHFNQVDIYDDSELVWQGFIYGIGRKFTNKGVALAVDCVGWVAKFGMLTTATNLANEKGSTYITDHVLGDSELSKWISAGTVSTADYTIAATRDYSPYKTMREVMDDINSFNEWSWRVVGKKLYFEPLETSVAYITRSKFVRGAVTQDLSDFANKVYYSYKTTAGVVTKGNVSDTATEYPLTGKIVALGDGLTSSEASTLANLYLDSYKTLRSSSPVIVAKLWDTRGEEVPLSQVQAGKVLRIEDLAVDSTTLSAAYEPNDIDVFRIATVNYNADKKELQVSPGKPASRLPVILARMGLKK